MGLSTEFNGAIPQLPRFSLLMQRLASASESLPGHTLRSQSLSPRYAPIEPVIFCQRGVGRGPHQNALRPKVEELLQQLQAGYPAAFTKGAPKPLAIGVHHTIQAELGCDRAVL